MSHGDETTAVDPYNPLVQASHEIRLSREGGRVSDASLRDYFAGQALAGICGDGIPGSHHRPEQTAIDAYAYADAMLAARNSGGADV